MAKDLKTLVSKLNDTARQALEGAAGICVSRTNYNVEIEHWLLKILEQDDTDLARLLRYYEIDPTRLERDLTRGVDQFKRGNSRSPALSPKIVELIESAWISASIEFGVGKIRTAHILVALVDNRDLGRIIEDSAPDLSKISADQLKKELLDIISGSSEDHQEVPLDDGGRSPGGGGATPKVGTQALDQFTVDLTQRARDGEIDPVLGRDFEIRQVVDILTRRRQNNPIMTGEAGVGKTAVVEGFALRIAKGDVPEPLKNVALRVLDLGLLQAGAGVKGEFENRLKNVINEVKASPQPIIIFIDEAHTLIGAGGQAGQGDAANLLKPALARGELRTIAATTWSEYKQYFENDAALTRRFQVVKVEEPDEEKGITMLRGIAPTLERHHGLEILHEAIEDAVRLSRRYITWRQLPDKAVSILDTAGARVAIGHASTPPSVEDTRRQIDRLSLEIEILEREAGAGADHTERLEELKAEKTEAEGNLTQLEERWNKEREMVSEIRGIRRQLGSNAPIAGPGDDEGEDGAAEAEETPSAQAASLSDDERNELQSKLQSLNAELKELQGEDPLMQVCVDSQTIAEVISGWTGIPVGKMLTDEIRMISELKSTMEERVVGQSHALEAITKRIQTARANLTDPRRPQGVFLLVGPSGVGKTETALTLADSLYGGERNMVTINMSEYQEAHTVSGLKGAPPGYVGYGKGGVLTEAVRRKPYCVVLLDEVEKAHTDVLELFYQVFDKGTLEDGEGREIDFKNTVILLTSNVGSDLVQSLSADPDTRPDPDGLTEAIRPELLKAFQPALLGRMTVVPYYSLGDDVMANIITLQITKIAERLQENHGATLEYSDDVIKTILDRCNETESGARAVDHILTGSMLPAISREILARMGNEEEIHSVKVGVGEDGSFSYDIT